MRKLLAILIAVALVSGIAVAIAWACCGGSEPISIYDIKATPNPAPCIDPDAEKPWGDISIDFTVMLATVWNYRGTYAKVYVGGTEIANIYVGSMGGTYKKSVSWAPTEAGTYSLRIEATNGVKTISEPGPDIVVEPCCIEGVQVKITPETFNVQRAGNYVMGHVTAPEGTAALTGGTIISIGGIACNIAGTAEPGGPIRFSSAEFSIVAATIVPPGAPRAEDVEVVVVANFADGTIGCDASDKIDIINEGKGK